MAARASGIQVLRRVVLGASLLGVTLVAFLHQRLPGLPPIDAIDPFGGLETLLKFVAGGELIQRIQPGTIVLFGAVLVLGILLSRFFCGWLCAFGALQGVFGALGKKIFRRRFVVPARVDGALRLLKYPLLAAIIFFTWRAGELVIRPYDPMAAYAHLSAGLGLVWAEYAVGLVLLAATILLSTLYERAFCKYLCPLGALNAILGRVPIFRIKRESSTCISCSACDRSCPMNVEVSKAGKISSPECIACMECVTACPTGKRTLAPTLGGKPVKVATVLAVGLAIYIGAAFAGRGLGMLSFAPKPFATQAAAGALGAEGASDGPLVVPPGFELEGTMSVQDVAKALSASPRAVIEKLGLPADFPTDKRLRDVKDAYGYTMPALKARIKE
jgi:ferredoxin